MSFSNSSPVIVLCKPTSAQNAPSRRYHSSWAAKRSMSAMCLRMSSGSARPRANKAPSISHQADCGSFKVFKIAGKTFADTIAGGMVALNGRLQLS